MLFLDALSVREFERFPFSYDVSFFNCFYPYESAVIFGDSNFDRTERNRLMREVRRSLYGFYSPPFDTHELINVIRPYVTIQNQSALEQALRRFFSKRAVLHFVTKRSLINRCCLI